jgi:universal stress protein A
MPQPRILCPVDFSIASRGALRHAGVLAHHFGAALTVLTVSDPILSEAAELEGNGPWLDGRLREDLQRFAADVLQDLDVTPHLDVATGKGATEILKRARTDAVDLIVMSSRGNSGVRKFFFGATAERVLRETTVPVLVTPAGDSGPRDVEDLRQRLRSVLAPLDFSGTTSPRVEVAREIADAARVKLLLAHVIEPLWFPTAARPRLSISDIEQRNRAEAFLADAAGTTPDRKVELLTAYGDPAEEIAKITSDRNVGLVVIALHASPKSGPRMGSVTYRVLCLAHTLVLALPPFMSHALDTWKPRRAATSS